MTRIGSLCTGYGGLCELGLAPFVGGTVAWHADNDPAAAKVLAHHWPDTPNLGDITAVDWATVEPVKWLTAGYPCPPFSVAGKRKGEDDPRNVWPHVARAVGELRPRRVLLENVAGHVSLGLGAVLWNLAALGYDTTWGVVRAADAGAPHGRARVFVVACDTNSVAGAKGSALGRRRGAVDEPGAVKRTLRPDSALAAHANRDAVWQQPVTQPRRGGPAVAGLPRPDAAADTEGAERRGTQPEHLGATAGRAAEPRERLSEVAWGPYGPAIRCWEHVLRRPAPAPTEPGRNGQPRLSPAFVEFLMGLPAGHVTAVPGLTRNDMLRLLGNGVCPQQCTLAVRTLLRLERAA